MRTDRQLEALNEADDLIRWSRREIPPGGHVFAVYVGGCCSGGPVWRTEVSEHEGFWLLRVEASNRTEGVWAEIRLDAAFGFDLKAVTRDLVQKVKMRSKGL